MIPWDELEWGYRGTGWVTVTENAYFTNFILFAILWSSIMLAMESPAYPAEGSKAEEAFFGIDVAFTVVFTVEMGIQWAALGLGGYFAATANQLDFIIVFTAWLSLILELSGVDAGTLTALRSLRLLRILRPLRAVRRLPALRMVVDCTLNALPAIKWIMVLGVWRSFSVCSACSSSEGSCGAASSPRASSRASARRGRSRLRRVRTARTATAR